MGTLCPHLERHGVAFEDNVLRRLRTHGRTINAFYDDVRTQLVPKGTRISAADLRRWTTKFDRLQRTHAQLLPALRKERDLFVKEFKAGGAAWDSVA